MNDSAAHVNGSAPRGERWGVVGGGMLGMTMALRLARMRKHVTLFEAADSFGGLASPWQLGDVTWDRFYHVILLSDTHLRRLLGELGLEDELHWVQTRTGFYTDGSLHSMSNLVEFLRFPPLRLWDKIRLGATIWWASRVRDWRRLEKILATDWLRAWSGRRTLERIWLPLLRAKLGDNAGKASAAFIWAIIARMYAARRTGLKKEMFGYVAGGYARVLERFEKALAESGVLLRPGHALREARGRDGEVTASFANGHRETFDRLILTLPAGAVVRACPDLGADEQARFRGVEYQGIVCASLLLDEPLSPYYVTNITEPWVPFTAVIEMSALAERKFLGGKALVYLPRYVTPSDPFYERSDDEVRAEFLGALARMYPHFRAEQVRCFRVARVRQVLALSTRNYSERLPPVRTSVPGLYILNSAHIVNGTLNVNETVQLAERGLQEILADDRAPAPIHGVTAP